MITIEVKENQTIYDIAVQTLGNVAGLFEIATDNNLATIELTSVLQKGLILYIREDSVYKNNKVVKDLENKIIYNQ